MMKHTGTTLVALGLIAALAVPALGVGTQSWVVPNSGAVNLGTKSL